MKVCIIENIYPPYDRGGAEQVVEKTVEGLTLRGVAVVILTSTPGSDEVEKRPHCTVYRKRPSNLFFYTDAERHGAISRFFWHLIDMFHFGMARWVRNILEKEQPDVVHTHNLMGLSFLIPRAIRRGGWRHIHTIHDVQLVEPSAMILKQQEHTWRYTGFPTRVYSWITRHLVESPDIVISPSQFLLDFYRSRHFFSKSTCVVLRNPITFRTEQEMKETRKDPARPFRFLYVGQIEKHKGVLLLLEVMSALKKETIPSFELHIVGNGAAMNEVKRRASSMSHVIVHGRVGHNEIPGIFAQMDATVVPSLCYENSPTVIFESLTFGVPVIASNIEGIAELIHEKENGFTFVAGDASSLKEILHWSLLHPDVLFEMRKKSVHSVSGLSQGEYIEKLIALYRKTV